MGAARGIRSFPLEQDEHCRRAGRSKLPVMGSVFLKVNPTRVDPDTRQQVMWRLEISRGQKLAPATRQLSNVYCEVFWRGPMEKYGTTITSLRWLLVGQTKVKQRTVDPVFSRSDNSLFDLPPVWTDLEIEDRGPLHESLLGGGWVSRNQIPAAPAATQDGEKKKKKMGFGMDDLFGAMFKEKEAEDPEAIARRNAERLAFQINSAITQEVLLRLEATRLLYEQEEKERKAMAAEERATRDFIMEAEAERCAKQLEVQTLYSKQFQKLTGLIQNPPLILARARFLMAHEIDTGGLRLICQDPSSGKVLTIVTLSILYPEDEQSLCDQLIRLIGKQHPNTYKVIDYSMHQIRGFNATGQASVNERMGIIIMERLEGLHVMQYLQQHADGDNEAFLHVLRLILRGLLCLHEEDILHRNLHPEAPLVIANNAFSNDGRASRLQFSRRPNVKVGEYWLLQNPRKVGCEYSLGRADWGARATLPPEVRQKGRVDAKSDVYAFGMCVYYWATAGQTLQYNQPMTLPALETLRTHIPLKWGKWVHNLLRMCLQPNPDLRASVSEALDFLCTRATRQI